MRFGLEFLRKLKPVKYRFKAPLNDGRDHFGFLAQDIDKIVSKEEYGFVNIKNLFKDGENSEFLSIDYREFVAPLVKAVQELDKKVEAHNINAQLVKQLNELIERIEKLEKLIRK